MEQQERELKAKLFRKLLEVKKQIPYLKKDTSGFNFEYASPELVLGTLNPLLNEAGLFLKTEVIKEEHERVFSKPKYQDVTKYVDRQKVVESVLVDVYETLFHLTFRFTWIDTETGYEDSALFTASGINNDEQGQGSAQTYAERYFLLKTFNIPTGKDDPDKLSLKRAGAETFTTQKPVEATEVEKPWIKDAQVLTAIKRIEGGEDSQAVITELLDTYRISRPNMNKIKEAQVKPKEEVEEKKDDSTPEGSGLSKRKQDAIKYFSQFVEANNWVKVRAFGKKLYGERAFSAKTPEELVVVLTEDELTTLAKELKK